LWHDIMARLADMAVAFVSTQLDRGAAAFQLFDSWAGSLSEADYRTFVLPHSSSVFARLRESYPSAPAVHFGIGCDHLLSAMHDAGPTVMGLDWRTPIAAARERLGRDMIVQGNLDPALVLAGVPSALAGADRVLADNDGHPGHIFNLGHGVNPDTDPDVLTELVRHVHSATARPDGTVETGETMSS